MSSLDPAHTSRGRTRITSRALNRLVSAVSADLLGVDPGAVGVDLDDDNGELVLGVRTAIRVVSLDRVSNDGTVVGRSGGTVLDRASAAQEHIRNRVNELTGYRISRVDIRLTSADIRKENRVK